MATICEELNVNQPGSRILMFRALDYVQVVMHVSSYLTWI